MAIRQCDKITHKVRGFGRTFIEKSWEAVCDTCGASTVKKGEDAGLAHEAAWKEGFRPITRDTIYPLRWSCAGCMLKRGSSGVGKA